MYIGFLLFCEPIIRAYCQRLGVIDSKSTMAENESGRMREGGREGGRDGQDELDLLLTREWQTALSNRLEYGKLGNNT